MIVEHFLLTGEVPASISVLRNKVSLPLYTQAKEELSDFLNEEFFRFDPYVKSCDLNGTRQVHHSDSISGIQPMRLSSNTEPPLDNSFINAVNVIITLITVAQFLRKVFVK
jgi:hypothetical protein